MLLTIIIVAGILLFVAGYLLGYLYARKTIQPKDVIHTIPQYVMQINFSVPVPYSTSYSDGLTTVHIRREKYSVQREFSGLIASKEDYLSEQVCGLDRMQNAILENIVKEVYTEIGKQKTQLLKEIQRVNNTEDYS